ncbi:hypothetical protein QOZ80_6BG0468560 [Eleusine coracana subsp. coracana]|nr:hypothetical protein QOZ80_6BG0468560 [Eleusine coracana subsp. coracana]
MAPAMREHLYHEHHVRSARFEPCPLGAAFVSFSSYLERDRLISEGERAFGPYALSFVAHDARENARECELDRLGWFLLLNYPLDCMHPNVIARSVAGFGILQHVHKASLKAGLVVRILLLDDVEIPDDVLVTTSTEPSARSFMVVVVPLRAEEVALLDGEEPPPDYGFAHPVPESPPRWLGTHPAGPSAAVGSWSPATNNGSSRHAWTSGLAPRPASPASVIPLPSRHVSPRPVEVLSSPPFEVDRMTQAGLVQPISKPEVVRVLFQSKEERGKSQIFDPRLAAFQCYFNCVAAALMAVATLPFQQINILDVGMATMMVDVGELELNQRFLIRLVTEPRRPHSCVIEELTEEETTVPATPRKRHVRKPKAPIDVSQLRRSKSPDLGGFKDRASAEAAGVDVDAVANANAEVTAWEMAVASGSEPPPYMLAKTAQANGTGFLKMHPADVSIEALEAELHSVDD